MRLKLYRAASVAEAMALVREDLGTEALILSTRRVAQGVELTAALEQEDAPEPLARPLAAPALPTLLRTIPEPPPPSGMPNLAFHGIPASLAARLAGPDLTVALRAALRFGMLPIAQNGPPLLLAGLPGAGKTLTIARLATRLVLAGIAPMVITADGRRAGATEQLAAFTRLLGLNLVVATHPSTLGRALARRKSGEPVLIDTPGSDPFDPAQRGELSALVSTAGATLALVLPGGVDPAESADLGCGYADIGATMLVATRLDLARRLGGVVAAAQAGRLSLTEAGTGPGASDGLVPLTPGFLAERLRHARPPDARSADTGGR